MFLVYDYSDNNNNYKLQENEIFAHSTDGRHIQLKDFAG